jgi:hypothetical protein
MNAASLALVHVHPLAVATLALLDPAEDVNDRTPGTTSKLQDDVDDAVFELPVWVALPA